MEIIAVTVVTAPHSVSVVNGVVTDTLDVMIGVMHGIGVGVLSDVNVDTFAVATTVLEFAIPTALEGFSW